MSEAVHNPARITSAKRHRLADMRPLRIAAVQYVLTYLPSISATLTRPSLKVESPAL